VHAVDVFTDLDLRGIAASATVAEPYPAALPAVIAALPPAACIYSGALENHPDVLKTIAAHRPLAGCPPDAVAAVRDPPTLAAALRGAGLSAPACRTDPTGVPRDGSWLVKPRKSAGGHGIAPWHGPRPTSRDHAGAVAPFVWQRRVAGRAAAASFLITAGGTRLIGASRQLLGRRWCHAVGFCYCGSLDIDPGSLPAGILRQVEAIGRLLSGRFALVGLVGVDLVIDRDVVHVIEVNPRPTASMELIERSTGLSLAAAQLAACGRLAPLSPATWSRRGTWSKAILFAHRELVCDEGTLAALRTAAGAAIAGWPAVADIPAPPQVIPQGRPVCTLFAVADSPRESLRQLRDRVVAVDRRLSAARR